MSAPLLLHSLAEYEALLMRAFETVGARTFVEIGSETGAFTQRLLAYVAERDGTVTTVEPYPATEIAALAGEHEAFTLVEGLSPGALERVGAADAWIIDGDHNYWTVARELDAALDRAEQAGRPSLLVLHDVGWPCARRDFYYAPDALPAEAVHPYTYTHGLVPDDEGVVDSGLRGEGVFAVAEREGGERNGVLTAVEDVMARRGGLRLDVLPPVYGVGMLYPIDAPWAGELHALLAPYAELDLMKRLEDNRMRLYLRVLELQDAMSRADGARNRMLAGLDERIARLEAENAALRIEAARRREAA